MQQDTVSKGARIESAKQERKVRRLTTIFFKKRVY
jgi:hypothetical protein